MTDEILKTPAEWSKDDDWYVMDPDGWRVMVVNKRGVGIASRSFDDPITREEYDTRAVISTLVHKSHGDGW